MKQLLVFSRKNCGPCKMYAPIVEQYQNEYPGLKKIDIEDMPEAKDKYNLKSVPTSILFEDGIEVSRLSGVVSLSKLKELLGV